MVRVSCGDTELIEQYRHMRGNEIPAGAEELTCPDIIEALLQHADLHDKFIESFAGRPAPWRLGDNTIKRVDKAIASTRAALRARGLKPGSGEFRKRLATALYFYAQMPSTADIDDFRRSRPHTLESLRLWMDREAQARLMDYFEKAGGLGLAVFRGDAPMEASAEEAIEQQRGLCTERSNVIYAVFERAGLKPFFAHMSSRQAREAWKGAFHVTNPLATLAEDNYAGHVAVGIMAEGKPVYFEPNDIIPDFPYQGMARKISLREMYQLVSTNAAGDALRGNDVAAAERIVEGAMKLGQSLSLASVHYHRSEIFRKKGMQAKAAKALEDALESDPDFVPGRAAFCEDILNRQGNYERSAECYSRLPDDETKKPVGLAWLSIHDGKMGEAREHIKRALAMDYHRPAAYIMMADTFIAENSFGEAKEFLERALRIDPLNQDARLKLADIVAGQGDAKGALGAVEQALALNIELRPALLRAAQLHLKLDHRELARQYFRRYLSPSAGNADFSYETCQMWSKLCDELSLWSDVKYFTGRFLNSGGKSPSALLLYVTATSRTTPAETGKHFTSLLHAIGGTLAGSNPEKLPPQVYWRLTELAEVSSSWPVLADFCLQIGQIGSYINAYRLYAIHAAWRSGKKELLDAALGQWTEFVNLLEQADPATLDIKKMGELIAVIDELPKEMLPVDGIRSGLDSYRHLVAMAAEAQGTTARDLIP